MTTPSRIVVFNWKGGVGKTTSAILAAEWFNHQNVTVNILDADGNQSAREWVDHNKEEGRTPLTPTKPQVEIIDTRGAPGSGAGYLDRADLILTPFLASGFDVSQTVDAALSLEAPRQSRLAFFANRIPPLGPSKEEAEGIADVRKLAEAIGARFLGYLTDRPAVFKPLYNGSPANFFDLEGSESFRRGQDEARDLLRPISAILGFDHGESR